MPNTKKPWFQRRHYDFLVQWAATNVTPTAVASLAEILQVDNPRFDRKRFLKTYVELRRFAQRHEAVQIVHRLLASATPDGMTDEDRRRFNAAADAIVEADLAANGVKPFLAPEGQLIPQRLDAYLRRHADANRGRGMWEYTRCWKCGDGRHPDKCPVACKGACEYPSAINN